MKENIIITAQEAKEIINYVARASKVCPVSESLRKTILRIFKERLGRKIKI